MKNFKVEVVNGLGNSCEFTVPAYTRREACKKVEDEGYQVVSCNEIK